MSESDLSILSPNIARALVDKIYDKRKVAALEIEKLFLIILSYVNN